MAPLTYINVCTSYILYFTGAAEPVGQERPCPPPKKKSTVEKRTEAERDNILLLAPNIFEPSAASALHLNSALITVLY